MHARAFLIVIVVVLTASVAVAQDTQNVVLLGGTTLEVAKATVQGGLVYLTYASGQMQAYPVEEVDLVASGLAPAASAAGGKGATQRTRSMADAISKATTESSIKITDQDVEHVLSSAVGGDAGEEEDVSEEDSATAAALLISNLRHQIAGAMVNITGTVHNSGTGPVSAITLQAKAVKTDGELAGSGSTTISQELKPKGEVGFTMSFPAEGRVADIQVRAIAAVAAFDFQPVTPPGAEDEDFGG